jgi:hypothetical protein
MSLTLVSQLRILIAARSRALGGRGPAPAGTAFADPPEGGEASCMGYEASDVSPPGSIGAPGSYASRGMPGVLDFIEEVVIPFLGAPNSGQVIANGPAQLRGPGSHEACDEALGIPPGAEG